MAAASSRRRRISYFGAAIVFLAVFFSAVAVAQERALGGKFRSGPDVVIRRGERVSDDLYASAGRVDMAGLVRGDLIAAGGEINLSGSVRGDVVAAGGRVRITGNVSGDVRAAGGQVSLQGVAAEDVLAAGGEVTVARRGRIGGDLVFSAGRMTMDGRVQGDVLGSAGTYARRGFVRGDEDVSAGRAREERPTVVDRIFGGIRRFLIVLLVGALLLWLAPRALELVTAQVRHRTLLSAGVGVLGLLGYVLGLVALIIAVVLISVVLGLLGFGSLVAALGFAAFLVAAGATFALLLVTGFVADAVVSMAGGRLALRPQDETSRARSFAALALGVAVVVILTSIPFVGPVVKLLVVLVGLGAVVLALRRRRAPVAA